MILKHFLKEYALIRGIRCIYSTEKWSMDYGFAVWKKELIWEMG